jgi:hypothetical protein
MRFAIAGAVVAVAMVAGCADEPAPPRVTTVLPGCDAIAAVLAEQGMPSPSPASTIPTSRAGESDVSCVFAPAAGSKAAAIGHVHLLLHRLGVNGLSAEFRADTSCDGVVAYDRTLPGGSSCYLGTHTEGTATVTGSILGLGIRIVLRWSDPAAVPDALHTDTIDKADAVADAVAAALFAANPT